MADTSPRINFNYNRKDELMELISKLKDEGYKVNLSVILEALLDDYLDNQHKKAAKGKSTHEYMRILIDGK